MSACRARPARLYSIGAAVLLIAASAGPALADQHEIGPEAGTAPAALGPPTLLMPRDAPSATAREPGQSELDLAPRRRRGIEVDTIGGINLDAIGILGPENGGFGRDLWRGTSWRSVERLMPGLTGEMGSPAMRRLARRLLLTGGAPPRRLSDSPSDDGGFLSLRIDRLAALGDVAGLNGLLSAVPQRVDEADERIARARVEGLLLTGKTDQACQRIGQEINRRHDVAYWRKSLVFCQIAGGRIDQARLALDLMREQGMEEDRDFLSLVSAYDGVQVAQVAIDSPLDFALLGAVGQPYPEGLSSEASPGLLVALADAGEAPLEQRAEAAEKAVQLGVMAADRLTALYRQFQFDAERIDAAGRGEVEPSGPAGRALLYQAIATRVVPGRRASLLSETLETARDEGRYAMAVQVLLPVILEVEPRPEIAWFAADAGRALYATGRFEEAGTWLTLARQEAIINPDAATAAAALWPYGRLAGYSPFPWSGDLEGWTEARSVEGGPSQRDIAMLRSAFTALGESDSLAWIDLVAKDEDERRRPDAALLYALEHAGDMRRTGETVLLALLALGPAGPGDSHPVAFNKALQALRQVGLEREARSLAIEAALAKGL